MPRDQQQGVVDADAQADHRGHRRGRGADVHRGGEQRDAGRADAEAEQGDGDGQSGADHRAEGQHQDEQRDHDADQLALALHRGGRGVGQLAAQLDLEPASRVGATAFSSGARFPIRSSSVTGTSYCTVSSAVSPSSLVRGARPPTTWSIAASRVVSEATAVDGDWCSAPVVHDDPGAGVAGAGRVLAQLLDAALGPGARDVPVVMRGTAEGSRRGRRRRRRAPARRRSSARGAPRWSGRDGGGDVTWVGPWGRRWGAPSVRRSTGRPLVRDWDATAVLETRLVGSPGLPLNERSSRLRCDCGDHGIRRDRSVPRHAPRRGVRRSRAG